MPFEKCYRDKKDFKTEATSSKGVPLIKVPTDSLLISYSKADIFQGVS